LPVGAVVVVLAVLVPPVLLALAALDPPEDCALVLALESALPPPHAATLINDIAETSPIARTNFTDFIDLLYLSDPRTHCPKDSHAA
jgi:hypothetical protein